MNHIKTVILFAFVCIGYMAKAQTAMPDTATKNFLMTASIVNLQEVADGKVAAQKAKDVKVKAFGNRMITDHTDAQNKLLQLIKSKGWTLPPQATGSMVPDVMLGNVNGSAFEKMYVHMIVSGHHKTVSAFQAYATIGKDPDVKAFAQQMLPILKQHLETVKALDKQLMAQ